MTGSDISARVSRLYEQHGNQLRRFLWGILRDSELADDCLHSSLLAMIESGGPRQEEAEKAWLFRVAYHAALVVKRKQAVDQRAKQKLAQSFPQSLIDQEEPLLKAERFERVRAAVQQLPEDQQTVVRMRMHENKTFAEIATELEIPLGTALYRMRAALKKLRITLADDESP